MVNRVALETTLLVHGVPRDDAMGLYDQLCMLVRESGAEPALVGVVDGEPSVSLSRSQLHELLHEAVKVNSANLGLVMHAGLSGATTVSATMEVAAGAGIQVFATGGIGGVHQGYGQRLDISADLAAFTRFPVAVVTSGVKAILDVESTREALESLGVPVVGFGTDHFPAFYLRYSDASVDARFDSVDQLADFVAWELKRTGRGIVVAQPVPEEHAVSPDDWRRWMAEARAELDLGGLSGRAVTPALLAALSDVSDGATLRANYALIEANAVLAGRLANALSRSNA